MRETVRRNGAIARPGHAGRTIPPSDGVGKLLTLTHVGQHIAIIAPPTAGHFNPLAALGTALAAAGARVTFVHMAEARSLVPGSAVGFAELDHPDDRPGKLADYYRKLAQPSGVIGLPRMIRGTAAITELLLRALPAALQDIEVDAVIADSAEPAGALVARHLDLPFVTAVTGLPLLRELGVPPPFLGWAYRADRWGRFRNGGGYAVSDALLRPITETVSAHARRWGLDPSPRKQWSDRLQIAQCPEALDFPRTALPARFHYGAPWRLEEAADMPLPDDDRPLVFCSLGSLQGARRSLFAAMTRACAALGARAVVAHGGGLTADEVASLPGDPLVRAFWPQTRILPRCSAAILHAGFNTVLDALAAGVPIVAVPLAFEQPATAARLNRIGAACVVSPTDASRSGLETALKRVLNDPRYRHVAQTLAGEIAAADDLTATAALVLAALRADDAIAPATRNRSGSSPRVASGVGLR